MPKDFATFAKNYKPLRFKFIFRTTQEYLPKDSIKLFDWLHAEWISLKGSLRIPINYFDVRFTLTPEGKKRADMAFITHVIRKCDTDVQNTPRIRFYMTQLRYYPELWYINRHIGTKQADNYMLRWGYLLDHDPSFDDLIHGTSVEEALYSVENII